MLGANTTISIARLLADSSSQDTYGAPHLSGVQAYLEPASPELVLAQGAPVGQMYSFYTDRLTTPTDVQNTDLLTTSEGTKYIVTGIQRYENHLVLTTTSYEQPL